MPKYWGNTIRQMGIWNQFSTYCLVQPSDGYDDQLQVLLLGNSHDTYWDLQSVTCALERALENYEYCIRDSNIVDGSEISMRNVSGA